MPIIISDDFNRANNTTAMGTTPVGGKVWTNTGSGRWGISSNQAYPANSSSYDFPTYIDTGISDQFAFQYKIATHTTTLQAFYRMVTDDDCFLLETPGLYRYNGGNYTELGRFTTAAGDTIRVEVKGNVHTVFRNGTQVLQVTDSNHLTGKRFGFGAQNTAPRVDDFQFESLVTEVPKIAIGQFRTGNGDVIPIYSITNHEDQKLRIMTTDGKGFMDVVPLTDSAASHIRVRIGGVTYALKKDAAATAAFKSMLGK